MIKNIFVLILFSLLLTGCSNMNIKDYTYLIDNASKNLDSLLETDYKDIEADLGSPFRATYYIDADKLRGKDVDSLSLDDIMDSISSFASYKDKANENQFLNVYYENGIIKQTLVGDYESLKSKVSSMTLMNNYDYKLDFFKEEGLIDIKDFHVELAHSKFFDKSIYEFNESYDVDKPSFMASTINDSDKVYFYTLVEQNLTKTKENTYPNYQSNSDYKLGYVNPINNNISYSNKSDSNDLSLYTNKYLLVYANKYDVIEYITIVDKEILYSIISRTLGPVSNTSNQK